MELQRKYIEEVGEAVEALGIMLEKELEAIKRGLAEQYQLVTQIKDEEKNIRQEMQEFKEESSRTQKLLEGFETILSRIESKLIDMQKGISDEEDFVGEVKSDLLVIKRDLQFARSDLKKLLKQQEDLGKYLRDTQWQKERTKR